MSAPALQAAFRETCNSKCHPLGSPPPQLSVSSLAWVSLEWGLTLHMHSGYQNPFDWKNTFQQRLLNPVALRPFGVVEDHLAQGDFFMGCSQGGWDFKACGLDMVCMGECPNVAKYATCAWQACILMVMHVHAEFPSLWVELHGARRFRASLPVNTFRTMGKRVPLLQV